MAIEGEKSNIRVNSLAPTAHTQMTEGIMPEAVLQAFRPAAVTPGLLYLVSEDAPTRAILCAGAGTFERAYVTLTKGVHLGTGPDVAEQVAQRFEAISDRADGEIVPAVGAAQPQNELGMAGVRLG